MQLFSRAALAVGAMVVIQVVPSGIHAQTGPLRITSPADGTLVNCGQTLTITVAADASLQDLAVVVDDPVLPFAQPVPGTNQFSLGIPATERPGIYHPSAIGTSKIGPVFSAAVSLDIERSDDPLGGLEAEPGFLQFDYVGDQGQLRVVGTFLDGTSLDLTKSSRTVYIPKDPKVVKVGREGTATAVGPGKTAIVVQQGQSATTRIFFPVIVEVPEPSINSLSPSSGIAGTSVTIDGSGFDPTQGSGDAVSFGGVTATPTRWTADTIEVPVPGDAPVGNVKVVVTVGGFPSNQITFDVKGPKLSN